MNHIRSLYGRFFLRIMAVCYLLAGLLFVAAASIRAGNSQLSVCLILIAATVLLLFSAILLAVLIRAVRPRNSSENSQNETRLAFLTDNRWHPVRLSAAQTVRCSRFVDRENLSACRARLRFNERAAAELLEQACALMAQAKSCHDELETYYRTAVDFAQVDAAAAQCMELFGVG